MYEDEKEILKYIKQGILEKNHKLLNDKLSEFTSFCYTDTNSLKELGSKLFTDEFVVKLLALLENENFLTLKISLDLFNFIQRDWGRFTIAQQSKLISYFKKHYSLLVDDTSKFLIIELFAEDIVNKTSLDLFYTLKSSNIVEGRGLVAEGYKNFILRTKDEILKREAINELFDMKSDSSKQIREYVNKIIDTMGWK